MSSSSVVIARAARLPSDYTARVNSVVQCKGGQHLAISSCYFSLMMYAQSDEYAEGQVNIQIVTLLIFIPTNKEHSSRRHLGKESSRFFFSFFYKA